MMREIGDGGRRLALELALKFFSRDIGKRARMSIVRIFLMAEAAPQSAPEPRKEAALVVTGSKETKPKRDQR